MAAPDLVGSAKAVLFLGALWPAFALLWGAFTDALGANPVERIEQQTGLWALYFLLASLCVTPLRRLLKLHPLVRLRRMLGLYAFFYSLLHLFAWLLFDHFFDWHEVWRDTLARPYLSAGWLAFGLLLALALTSTGGMVRRLGGARWRALHSAVYLAAACVILHYLWLVKADRREPILYGLFLLALLAARLPAAARRPLPP